MSHKAARIAQSVLHDAGYDHNEARIIAEAMAQYVEQNAAEFETYYEVDEFDMIEAVARDYVKDERNTGRPRHR